MPRTPILDLACDPPPLRRSWLSLLIGVALGLLLWRWDTLDTATWFPVLFASIALHEIGHVVAGKLAGMDTGGVVICGLMILKSGPRWICQFDIRRLFSGGVAKPLPKKGDFDREQAAWMVAGGPLTTLLVAILSGIAYSKSAGPPGWLSSFWWVNLILFAGAMFPSRGINKSDGARLWMLLRNPEETRSWAALLQLMTEETAGVLPRDWDSELFARMMQYRPGSSEAAYRELLAYYRKLDQRDIEAALEHFEKALAAAGSCGRLTRFACFLEASGVSALVRGNAAAARTWLARASKLRKPPSRHGVDAAIAQCEGRYAEALRSWDAALAFVEARKYDSGLARFGKAKIAEYQEQCREALRKGRETALAGGA